ncbi:MAG: signal peptidase II, partial [Desulfobulbaceae bacterium]|nr:signal peptidase II [Desulfobulbaceae bacterium]
FFDLVFVTNSGAAFGLLAGPQVWWRQLFFVSVALLALGVLVGAYRHYRLQGNIWVVAIGLVAGGAVGNLIDRLRFGAVIDFLDFYVKTHHWPAFNVADSAITVGVCLFILASWQAESQGDDGNSGE